MIISENGKGSRGENNQEFRPKGQYLLFSQCGDTCEGAVLLSDQNVFGVSPLENMKPDKAYMQYLVALWCFWI